VPPPPHADGRKILLFPRVLSKVSPEETSTSFSPFIFRDTGPDGSNLDLATNNNVTNKKITLVKTKTLDIIIVISILKIII
tara:strand:- start:476 stop:718 length:243 start_codon:yes stop_codon:yes gene_type:complete